MELVVDEAAEQRELRDEFEKVGTQFRSFYEGMRAAGHSKKMARRLTERYCQVVCELLYVESGAADL